MRNISICIALITVFFSASAFAQRVSSACPEAPMDEQEGKELARIWFDKGKTLVEEELFDEAVGAFGCSTRMLDHPATRMNAGKAAVLAGDKKEALLHFEAYLELAPKGKRRDEVEKKVASLKEDIAAEEPEPSEAEPLPEEPEPVEEDQILDPVEPPKEDVSEKERLDLRVPAYVSLALGGAALVMGGVFQGLAGKNAKDGEETSDYATFEDKKDKMESFQKGATAGFAVGGVAVITGVILLLVSDHDDGEEAQVALVPTPAGISLGGKF